MILVYHHICRRSTNDDNVVSVATFDKHMAEIKRQNYKVVKITEYDPNDTNQIVLRFDDGYLDIMNALPILRRYGYPFHVYVVGDWFGKNGFIGEHHVAEIKKSGGTLEWHTNTHADLTTCTDQELLNELTIPASIKNLDRNGFTSIAYPFWKYDARVCRTVRRFFKCGGVRNLGGGKDNRPVLSGFN